MADKLTPQQKEAVCNRGGKLLVSAAAGSGKTKVLVDRLLSRLMDPMDPANLDEFLIITYTKAAATELRGKIAAKLTERIAENPENRHLQRQMQRLFLTKISTVHGFCGDLLRENAYKLDIPADFRVADENECSEMRDTVILDLLENAYRADGQDADFRTFVDTQGLGRDDRLVPEILLKVYDSARCHLDPEGWLEKCIRESQVEDVQDVSETVWGRYLMEELFACLDSHIRVMRRCAVEADGCPGMEKAASVLWDTVFQMESLRRCELWDEILRKKNIDFGRLTFPRKNPDPELTERIKAARNACKKALEKKLTAFSDPSERILQDLQQCGSGIRGLVALVRTFDRDYARLKRSRRVLDFSDLEHKTLDLLLGKMRSSPTATAVEVGRRYREIMVDEYQDSNGVQDAIFDVLTRETQNCFMVGDVKQSIYQFRLADPGIFLKKYETYVSAEEAEPGQGRKVLLSHNFRSGGEIIEAVNSVFSTCMRPRVGGLHYTEAEALRQWIPKEPMPDRAVELHCIGVREDTYAEESAYVADRIGEMLRQGTLIRGETGFRPVTPEDIVILLRSPGSIGNQFQRALEARGIRCASGGGVDLLQTEEIATLRSLLQVIVNPRQDIPLISVLASPVFGFTADDLAVVRGKQRSGTFYDALLESGLRKAEDFLTLLTELRGEARMEPLTKLLENCLARTRMDSIYGSMFAGEVRQANLQTFFQLASEFEKGSLRDLSQFLDHLQALEEKGLLTASAASEGCVTIMSIHKSKGLEFPVVFLCGLSRSFNRESLHAPVLCDKQLGLGLSVADTHNRVRYPSVARRAIMEKTARESISEEMRVLYVAMTRARDRLIMTYAVKNLEGDLQDIAMRMDFDGGEILCQDVVCPGEWVLLTAMGRSEAADLHALGGKPQSVSVADLPWKIVVSEAAEECCQVEQTLRDTAAVPENTRDLLASQLSFRYGWEAATMAPSKQTATDRKGRQKDGEAAENSPTRMVHHRQWRKPGFLSEASGGKAYGNAIHIAMQYIRYENCKSVEQIHEEVTRLVREGFLTEQQGEMVDCLQLAAFFNSPIGQKLCSGVPCIREFKFSILDEGTNYGDGLEGEQVLLQGVVDCALLERDGITILDFKTDRVGEDTISAAAERYRPQVETYAHAISRIFEKKIRKRFLYFFRLDRFVEIYRKRGALLLESAPAHQRQFLPE